MGIALLVGGLVGCGGEAEPEGDRAARIRLLERQIAGGHADETVWRPWFRALKSLGIEKQTGREFIVDGGNAQLLWNERLARNTASQMGQSALVRVARELRELRVDLVVVPIPHRSVIYPGAVDPGSPPPRASSLPDFRLREIYLELEKNGVEVLDLVPAFREGRFRETEGADGELLTETVFLPYDFHWSPYGAQLAAKVLAERIRFYPWYPEVERRGGRAHLAPLEPRLEIKTGSFARRMIEEGLMDPSQGKERFFLYETRIEGERWSFDDRRSPIVVMGTSFTRANYGLTDGLLRNLGFRVDRVTVAGGAALGPYERLRSRRQGVTEKKLVIWVFHSQALAPLSL